MGFRILAVIVTVATLAMYSAISYGHPDPVFMTSWMVYIDTLYYVAITIYYIKYGNKEAQNNIKTLGFLRFMLELATTFSFLVFLFYWVLIYAGDDKARESGYKHFMTFLAHMILPIIVFCDNILSLLKYKKKDFWFIVLIAVLYGLTNLIYVKAKGRWVYGSLKWRDGWTALNVVIAAIIYTLGFFFFAWLNKKKLLKRMK
jgi:magnesium-transporting ATPase (P-type)